MADAKKMENGNANLVKRKLGYFNINKSSGIFIAPADLIKDPAFPFKPKTKVLMEITDRKLTITLPERFDHINTLENKIVVADNQLDRIIDVYVAMPGTIFCDYDKTNDCPHIEYALSLPEVKEALKKKGWKRTTQ